MAETWNKKERERNKQAKKKEKLEKRLERKHNKVHHDVADMLAYVDENGNLSSQPPDPRKKVIINSEDIDPSGSRHKEEDPEDHVHVGIVTFFNNDKGYGFIRDQRTKESVFVHVSSLTEAVKENNKVSFETETGSKGKHAKNVTLVRG